MGQVTLAEERANYRQNFRQVPLIVVHALLGTPDSNEIKKTGIDFPPLSAKLFF